MVGGSQWDTSPYALILDNYFSGGEGSGGILPCANAELVLRTRSGRER